MDHELVNQLVDGLPTVFRVQVNDDGFDPKSRLNPFFVGSRIPGFFRVRPVMANSHRKSSVMQNVRERVPHFEESSLLPGCAGNKG